jgi:hypothetical protein
MGLQYVFTKAEILQEILSSLTVQNTFNDYPADELEAAWETDLDGEDVIVVRLKDDPAIRYTPPPGKQN